MVRLVVGRSGKRADADAAHHPLRLRRRSSPGCGGRRAAFERSPAPICVELCTPVELHGEKLTTVAEFTITEGERDSVGARAGSLRMKSRVASATPKKRCSKTDEWWREWSRPLDVRRALSRAGAAVADHAQGADLCADRRRRRRADDVAAGADRQRPELGLSLLLGPRCDVHAVRPDDVRPQARRPWPGEQWLLRAVAGDRRRSTSCMAWPASGG